MPFRTAVASLFAFIATVAGSVDPVAKRVIDRVVI